MARELPSFEYLKAQMEILIRAARRVEGEYSRLIDSFQHIEDEADRTLRYLNEFK